MQLKRIQQSTIQYENMYRNQSIHRDVIPVFVLFLGETPAKCKGLVSKQTSLGQCFGRYTDFATKHMNVEMLSHKSILKNTNAPEPCATTVSRSSTICVMSNDREEDGEGCIEDAACICGGDAGELLTNCIGANNEDADADATLSPLANMFGNSSEGKSMSSLRSSAGSSVRDVAGNEPPI